MKYFVYVIINSLGRLYIGQTCNLTQRLRQHNDTAFTKYACWTKTRGPWQLLHTEQYDSRSEALRREKYLKGGRGRSFLKALASQINAG